MDGSRQVRPRGNRFSRFRKRVRAAFSRGVKKLNIPSRRNRGDGDTSTVSSYVSLDSPDDCIPQVSPKLAEPCEQDLKCPICLDLYDNGMETKTLRCSHKFHASCADQAIQRSKKCPLCRDVVIKLEGNQPRDGEMSVSVIPTQLPGYECDTITIFYEFPSGVQDETHPNPGVRYRGAFRVAYLPNNDEGNAVLELLRQAFAARLTFTIGTSLTTGKSDVITWNDIHHKTSFGPDSMYGYPDPGYLSRVTEDLHAMGIE